MAKVIKTGILHREGTFERASINAEKRTVDLSFSSELPVDRYFGVEILDHSAEAVDLSRLQSGGPLLMDHNSRDQIGVVDRAWLGDKRGKATVRFGNSQRAKEIFQDVMDGIRGSVSVGYRIDTLVTEKVEKGVETMRATKWSPMEISLVSIPADPTVGVGRSGGVDERQFETVIHERNSNMETPTPAPNQPAPAQVSAPAVLNVPDSMLKESIREVRAMAAFHGDKIPGLRELAIKAELADWPISRFRDEASKLVPTPPKPPVALPVVPQDTFEKYYSIARAISAKAENRDLTGLEREMSDEIAHRIGRTASGFWLPPQALMEKNMYRSTQTTASGAVGGFVIETDNLAEQFIEILRNRSQVMRLGAQVLQLSEPTTIPRQSSAGTANWVAETAATTPTTLGLTQITLSPKTVTAHFQYSKQLLVTGNPSIDALVRNDITNVIALAIDQVALHGGGSGEPNGIIASFDTTNSIITGTNGIAAATFGTTFYLASVSMETLLGNANADVGSLAYLARPSVRGVMKTAQRFSSTDSPVWNTRLMVVGQQPSAGGDDGIVNGYRAAVSNQIKTNLTVGTATTIASCIFFGNWNEVLIGAFNGGATDLVVDPYTLAGNRIVRVLAHQFVDVGLRHPLSFAVLNGIL
jgi:HK97 family phage major capsid protein